jgi:hypothetical protein
MPVSSAAQARFHRPWRLDHFKTLWPKTRGPSTPFAPAPKAGRASNWSQNLLEAVSGPSTGLKIEEGEERQPEEYMEIFRGLHFKPDKDIEPKGRL